MHDAHSQELVKFTPVTCYHLLCRSSSCRLPHPLHLRRLRGHSRLPGFRLIRAGRFHQVPRLLPHYPTHFLRLVPPHQQLRGGHLELAYTELLLPLLARSLELETC